MRMWTGLAGLFALGLACASALAQVAAPTPTPKDDPYLSCTSVLPSGVSPDRFHNLDAVAATVWAGIPDDLARECFGDTPTQRVIYRDSVTGAEVWLLLRSPADEDLAYTNYYPFNANGSAIRVWGQTARLRSDGACLQQFTKLIPHPFSGLPEWSRSDPDVVVCSTANGGRYEFNLKTGQRRDLFMPDPDIPDGTQIQFSDDGSCSMFITKQGARRPFFFWLGDGQGKNRRAVEVRSVSPQPENDRMGSAQFLRDQRGVLHARYSLNKGQPSARVPTPYQNWLVSLDGSQYRPMTSSSALLDDEDAHFAPAGSYVVTGHGGFSPSRKLFAHHTGRPGYKWVRDQATWQQRDVVRIPGCDHMDWTVDENWFFVWANQVGLPIYQVMIDTGVVHRVVCTNSCPHEYGSCPYHGSSPDGTKLLYKSSMLGNLDLYMAIARRPDPPTGVKVRHEGEAARIEWSPPARGKEIAGYHVYRSRVSGRDRVRVTREPVAGVSYLDPSPGQEPFYALTSVEHSGLEGRVFSDEVALEWRGPVSRFVEAEAGTLTYPMRPVFAPNGASADYAVTRAVRDGLWQPATGDAAARWEVPFPIAGSCALWIRTRSREGIKRSFALRVNGRDTGPVGVESQSWEWRRVGAFDMAAGAQQIEAAMPEAGIELDKLLLTADAAFLPSGVGDCPFKQMDAPGRLTAALDRGMVVLRWQAVAEPQVHHYQVYRGASADFAPEQKRLIGSPKVPAFIDPGPFAPGQTYYRVTAVDPWGNESGPGQAVVGPGVPPRSAMRRFVDMAAATLTGGASVVEDPKAQTGKCIAFGSPKEVSENAGEAQVTLDVEPGMYYLWLRVKGTKEKPSQFFWSRLGATENYARTRTPAWTREPEWVWRRVTFLNNVRDPQERPMAYPVPAKPVVFNLRHRANYLAVDQLFITDSFAELPSPDVGAFHPACPQAFRR